MNRALVWKEFREQRHLVAAAWLISLLLPLFLVAGMLATTPQYEIAAVGLMLPVVLLMLVCPVFAAAIGAMTVASDMSDGSLRFLLSRPISRNRIWATKVGVGAAALVLVVAGSLAIAAAFDYLVSGRVRFLSSPDTPPAIGFSMVLAALFVGAHYCSLFFRRPLAAALAGAVVAGSMAAVVGTAWSVFLRPVRGAMYLEYGALMASPLALSGMLLAAWWVFSRSDLFGAHAARRMASPLALVTAVVMLVGIVPSAYLSTRALTADMSVLPQQFRLVDGVGVLVQPTPSGLGTRLAVVDARTGEVDTLGPSGASDPSISADGELIAFLRSDNLANLGWNSGEIRVVRPDGSGERVVAENIAWLTRYYVRSVLSISPDERFVALYDNWESLFLVPIGAASAAPQRFGRDDGMAELQRLDLADGLTLTRRVRFLGWTATVPSELLYARSVEGGPAGWRSEIIAYEPAARVQRVVAELPGRRSGMLSGSRVRGVNNRVWRQVPQWLEDSVYAERMVLVDVASGASVDLSDSPCDFWGFSPQGSRFLYGHCSGGHYDVRAELHVRDLGTGADELFAVLENVEPLGLGRELLLSPDGSRLAIFLQQRGAMASTYLVPRAGEPQLVAPQRYPVAWLDDQHLVLLSDRSDEFDIEVVNIDTLVVRKVYERR